MPTPATFTNKFHFVYQPLNLSYSLDIEQAVTDYSDGVDDQQKYDVLGGGYYPDYTVFPLVLKPRVYAYDPDGVLGDNLVDVTKDVANMTWYVIEGGVKTQIQPTNTDYQIITSGNLMGLLKVKRNIDPDLPITLIYEAQYLDTRNGDVHEIHMSHLVRCDIFQTPCVLRLDTASQVFYNPFKNKVQTVHANILSGSKSVHANMRKCIWEVCNDDGVNWTEAGTTIDTEFAKVSDDTMSIEINMEYMGDEITVRCYGIVNDTPSALAAMGKASAFAYKQFKITRKLPKFNANVFRFPSAISKGQNLLLPEAKVDFVNYSTAHPEQEMDFVWNAARVVGGTVNVPANSVVARGMTPTIRIDDVTRVGQAVVLEVNDRGSYKILTDGNGNVLTDGDGKVLMVR